MSALCFLPSISSLHRAAAFPPFPTPSFLPTLTRLPLPSPLYKSPDVGLRASTNKAEEEDDASYQRPRGVFPLVHASPSPSSASASDAAVTVTASPAPAPAPAGGSHPASPLDRAKAAGPPLGIDKIMESKGRPICLLNCAACISCEWEGGKDPPPRSCFSLPTTFTRLHHVGRLLSYTHPLPSLPHFQ
jgi:hypothetical protein